MAKRLKIGYPKISRDLPKGFRRVRGLMHYVHNTLYVKNTKDKLDELDTFVHEGLHFSNPEFTEDDVEATSHVLARILWKAGYRKIK